MRERGIRPSMGAIASPWDNAPAESLTGTLERERVRRKAFETREQTQPETFEYIETSCNRLRIHSALGYMSPVEFEEKMAEERCERRRQRGVEAVNETGVISRTRSGAGPGSSRSPTW